MIGRILVAACLTGVAARGQSSVARQFEVADIRPWAPAQVDVHEAIREGLDTSSTMVSLLAGVGHPEGQLRLHFVPLKRLIMLAFKEIIEDQYGRSGSEYLKGGPGWLDSDYFDFVAKAPPNSTFDELRTMIQGVLTERFHLVAHREQKVMPAYALVTGKRGAKLRMSEGPGDPGCVMQRTPEPTVQALVCQHVTLAFLADRLPYFVGQPVTDLTDIEGTYDFKLDFAMGSGNDPAPSPSLFESLNGYGLALEKRRQMMPVIVIDHVDRLPTEN